MPPLSAGSEAVPYSSFHFPGGQTCVWVGGGHTEGSEDGWELLWTETASLKAYSTCSILSLAAPQAKHSQGEAAKIHVILRPRPLELPQQ